jgi:maleamate amidohydrolase
VASKIGDDLRKDYEKAGFGRELGVGKKPALILVDLMMAYFVPDAPLYSGSEAELANSVKLLAAARKNGVPVFFSKVEYSKDGDEARLFRRKIPPLEELMVGSDFSTIHPDIAPKADEPVLVKHYASSFFGTTLCRQLRELGCDSLIICGLTTSGCVRATALDALQNEFIPIVVEDAVGDRDKGVHDANIFDLGAKYAEIVLTRDAAKYMTQISN